MSWKNRPKRDNCWIEEDNFTEELKNRANTLKIPETQYRFKQNEYFIIGFIVTANLKKNARSCQL